MGPYGREIVNYLWLGNVLKLIQTVCIVLITIKIV